jgi:RNA polymerase sigma factor (sigma-70 family)
MAHAVTMDPWAMDPLAMDDLGFEGVLDGVARRVSKRRRPRAKTAPAANGATKTAPKTAAKDATKNADDLALVTALAGGERGAWNRFVARFSGVVFAAVQRRLIPAGRLDEVEDVVQEVFLRLCKADYRLLKSYDPARARLSTWLTVVATSAAIDHLRRQKMAKVAIDDAPEASLAVEDPAFENVKIPEGLLSARQALVLELLYRRDLEVADAAEIMQIDPQTVRSTHHKALTKLRAHFREIGEMPA